MLFHFLSQPNNKYHYVVINYLEHLFGTYKMLVNCCEN